MDIRLISIVHKYQVNTPLDLVQSLTCTIYIKIHRTSFFQVSTSEIIIPHIQMLESKYVYGAVVRALASHQCGPGLIPGLRIIVWVEFVVGYCLRSERIFSGNFSFPLSSKTLLNSNSNTKASPISALHFYLIFNFCLHLVSLMYHLPFALISSKNSNSHVINKNSH